jgi:hypothetical protein
MKYPECRSVPAPDIPDDAPRQRTVSRRRGTPARHIPDIPGDALRRPRNETASHEAPTPTRARFAAKILVGPMILEEKRAYRTLFFR